MLIEILTWRVLRAHFAFNLITNLSPDAYTKFVDSTVVF